MTYNFAAVNLQVQLENFHQFCHFAAAVDSDFKAFAVFTLTVVATVGAYGLAAAVVNFSLMCSTAARRSAYGFPAGETELSQPID